MGGFLELSYGLSFLVVTILANMFQFLSSKSLYQERSHAHGPFDNISVPIDVISVVKNERFLL